MYYLAKPLIKLIWLKDYIASDQALSISTLSYW